MAKYNSGTTGLVGSIMSYAIIQIDIMWSSNAVSKSTNL